MICCYNYWVFIQLLYYYSGACQFERYMLLELVLGFKILVAKRWPSPETGIT
jgi:hypothetical protein